jgi:hypothetical protein
MKTIRQQDLVGNETPTRREFLVRSVVAAATIFLYGDLGVAAEGKKTFTILHTNDLHSNFIGLGPASGAGIGSASRAQREPLPRTHLWHNHLWRPRQQRVGVPVDAQDGWGMDERGFAYLQGQRRCLSLRRLDL